MAAKKKAPKAFTEYLAGLPEDRVGPMTALRTAIVANLPAGFEETTTSNMPGWVVPLSTYPTGYLDDPEKPLPFLNIASQKNNLAVYHMGVYADPELHAWFVTEYPKHDTRKLDMGKSCIRFKRPDELPLDLIGELVAKVTPADWVKTYEASRTGA